MVPAERQFEVLASRVSDWLGSSCQVIGVGIDLVDVLAMTHLIENGGQMFVDDAWTPLEQQQALGDCRRLAGRWAIKEAVMKALGHGLGEISPLDIQTHSTKSGALVLELDASAALAADSIGASAWHISVAYDGSWAIGAAVAVRSGRKRRRKNEP
jgi:holo-[acyl-carrier protein] synthase